MVASCQSASTSRMPCVIQSERIRIMPGDFIMMYYTPGEQITNGTLNFFNFNIPVWTRREGSLQSTEGSKKKNRRPRSFDQKSASCGLRHFPSPNLCQTHLLSAICYLPSAICHLPTANCQLANCYLLICHLPSASQPLPLIAIAVTDDHPSFQTLVAKTPSKLPAQLYSYMRSKAAAILTCVRRYGWEFNSTLDGRHRTGGAVLIGGTYAPTSADHRACARPVPSHSHGSNR